MPGRRPGDDIWGLGRPPAVVVAGLALGNLGCFGSKSQLVAWSHPAGCQAQRHTISTWMRRCRDRSSRTRTVGKPTTRCPRGGERSRRKVHFARLMHRPGHVLGRPSSAPPSAAVQACPGCRSRWCHMSVLLLPAAGHRDPARAIQAARPAGRAARGRARCWATSDRI